MHEISIVRSIVDAMKSEVEKYNLQQVSHIHIRIGKLKAVEPESFSFYFSALSENTPFENAELEFDIVEPKAKCASCNGVFDISEVNLACPICGCQILDMIGGNELQIDQYEAKQ